MIKATSDKCNILIYEETVVMKKLRIHYLQHVSYEGLGNIEDWIITSGHIPDIYAIFLKMIHCPDIDDFDWLIVMGGPMSVNDEEQYPWLE